jgi:hypothetical protein
MAHIDFWPSPRAGGECAKWGRSAGRGITRPAPERSGGKGGDTAPIAKRSARARRRSSPCAEGGGTPFKPPRLRCCERARPKGRSPQRRGWLRYGADRTRPHWNAARRRVCCARDRGPKGETRQRFPRGSTAIDPASPIMRQLYRPAGFVGDRFIVRLNGRF